MLGHLLLALLAGLLAWPMFVAVCTAIGLFTGEAWQLDAWSLEPKRNLAQQFIDGWITSAPFAAAAALVLALDRLILGRYRLTSIISGIALPALAAFAVLALWSDPMQLLPAVVGSALALALGHRLLHALLRAFT